MHNYTVESPGAWTKKTYRRSNPADSAPPRNNCRSIHKYLVDVRNAQLSHTITFNHLENHKAEQSLQPARSTYLRFPSVELFFAREGFVAPFTRSWTKYAWIMAGLFSRDEQTEQTPTTGTQKVSICSLFPHGTPEGLFQVRGDFFGAIARFDPVEPLHAAILRDGGAREAEEEEAGVDAVLGAGEDAFAAVDLRGVVGAGFCFEGEVYDPVFVSLRPTRKRMFHGNVLRILCIVSAKPLCENEMPRRKGEIDESFRVCEVVRRAMHVLQRVGEVVQGAVSSSTPTNRETFKKFSHGLNRGGTLGK
ncbi:hypothetical protein BJ742DRAFT_742097 [Cladochytrium replicatum]|nr:hypothetical protein BJ742DRAFT_742097 [Cladochytrium replicatum]